MTHSLSPLPCLIRRIHAAICVAILWSQRRRWPLDFSDWLRCRATLCASHSARVPRRR
jgi:hypothetical protein